MNHVMIDLETFGLGMDAPIVAIGACSFYWNHRTKDGAIEDTFRATIPLKEAVVDGAVIDPDTVEFWLQQEDEARASLPEGLWTLHESLDQFAGFLENAGPLDGVWGNGAAFDNALLAQTYRRAGKSIPWSYKLDRCFRTIRAMGPGTGFERRPDLIEHDAVHDAVAQTEELFEIWRMR